MKKPPCFQSRYVSAQDFQDLRRYSGLTRLQVGKLLDVTARTIQNWETGGARIPWMAYRMLRILRGYDLPSLAWEGWTLRGDTLYSPDNRAFRAADLYWLQNTFAQAKLFRQLYARSGRAKTASTVLPFPDRQRLVNEAVRDARRPRTPHSERSASLLTEDLPAMQIGGRP
jgi:DNA-binding XRE family transcriptional regulator